MMKTLPLATCLVSCAGSVLLVACSAPNADVGEVSQTAAGSAAGLDCATFVESGPDVEAIRAAEEAGGQTNVSGDTLENARKFFAPEFWNVLPNGEVWAGAEKTLSMYRDGRLEPWARSFELQDLRIRVYCGRVGLTTGIGKAVPLNAPGDAEPMHYRFLHVWTRRGGKWRYTAQQYVGFKPDS